MNRTRIAPVEVKHPPTPPTPPTPQPAAYAPMFRPPFAMGDDCTLANIVYAIIDMMIG